MSFIYRNVTRVIYYPDSKAVQIYYKKGSKRESRKCLTVYFHVPEWQEPDKLQIPHGRIDTAATSITFTKPFPVGKWDEKKKELTIQPG